MKRRKKKSSNSLLLRLLLWGALIAVVAVGGVGLYGYIWIQGYLKSPAFQKMLAQQLGNAVKGEATLDSMNWSGPNLYVSRAGVTPKGSQGWKLIEGEGVEASVDFQAARSGVWRVTRIHLDRLRMDLRSVAEIPQELPSDTVLETAPPSMPGWLKRWLPTRTQIDEVNIDRFDLVPAKGTEGVSVKELVLGAKPATDAGAWLLRGSEGTLTLPGVKERFRMTCTSARLDARSLALNDGVAKWIGDSEVTARGDLPFEKGKAWQFSGHVANLELKHVLGAEWLSKVSGTLSSDYEVTPTVLKSKVQVKNGVVENLPLLNYVADFTRTQRFRRVVLDAATADIERAGDTTHVRNLVLQSDGLVRVQGDVTLQGRAIQGKLMVGVLPDSLRWIPGSQSQVFTEPNPAGPPGFVWTHVNITGTVDSIREDLSNRLLIAMGKAALDVPLDLAGRSLEMLGEAAGAPVSPTAVKEVTTEVMKAGTEVLKGSGDAAGKTVEKAVETGVDVLKGVVPIFGK
ncbi:hypothetical protein DES53_11620 [Roseimicrobium gellanilyticum]|uniref:AsmA-like protein n=1 Tax=Roseimicrobium gellanilyticum TaxID=748857 RepID=A0A366H3L2_9BACT|nr:hypothetical protein [Roseimicrobium gellanilyticum]RBP36581.1 hypothetical protein DES53_11620 [Roseimicrobium gellanilyticum]